LPEANTLSYSARVSMIILKVLKHQVLVRIEHN
jgi:hypothetical protein